MVCISCVRLVGLGVLVLVWFMSLCFRLLDCGFVVASWLVLCRLWGAVYFCFGFGGYNSGCLLVGCLVGAAACLD